MSKSPPATGLAPSDNTEEPTPSISLSLTEFCIRLSETVRRPELIGAFESVEIQAGNARGTEAEFRARFDAFINQPI